MSTSVIICKEPKVTGKRQTWALRRQRANVSATVWDRVPETLTYYKARDAMSAADQQFDLLHDWQRHAGRGSAYYSSEAEFEGECRTKGCNGDPDNGEGYDGYCGNCADAREISK